MNFKGIIFDLDGTLVNSLEDITDSTNKALRKFNFPVHDLKTYQKLVGHGIRNLIVEVLPETNRDTIDIENCYRAMKDVYRDNCLNKTKPYDGIGELLDELVSRKIKLAVFSNKTDEFTKHIVLSLLSNWKFEAIIGLSDEAHKKPDPFTALRISRIFNLNPEEIIYVGDSRVDMQTANNAGMYAVGVFWGFQGREDLLAGGARHIIDRPMDLMKLF